MAGLRAYDPVLGTTVDRPVASEEELTALTLPPSSDVARGLRSGVTGISAGSLAAEALAYERAGKTADFQDKLAEARSMQRRAGFTAPRVGRLRDIGGVGDVFDYAQGVVSQGVTTMAPPIAGGLTGGLVGGPAGAYLGAAAAGAALNRDNQILAQYNDPVQAAVDPETRANVALATGVGAGVLEAIVPAGLMRVPGVRQLTGRIAGTALSESGTELTQEQLGISAEDYLNPNRDKSGDTERLLDAAVAGGLTGGAVHGAARGPAKAAETAMDLLKASRKAGGNTVEFMKRAFPGRTRDEADQTASELELGDANPGLFDEDPFEFGRKVTEAGVIRAKRAADMAAGMIKDADIPDKIKATLAAFKGTFDSPEAQAEVAKAHYSARAGQVAAEVVAKFAKGWGVVKEVIRGAAKGAQEGAKKNAQTPEATFQDVLNIFNSNLKEQYLGSPLVVSYVRQIARALAGASGETLTDARIRAAAKLTRLVNNPRVVFEQIAQAIGSPELATGLSRITRASMDAADPGSVLRRSVVPEAAEYLDNDPEAAEELGRLVDRVITQGVLPAHIGTLAQVFGGEQQLNDVLNYYMEAHGKVLGRDKTVLVAERVLDSDDAVDEDPDSPEAQITTHETPEARYHFRRVGEENVPFESAAEARKLRQEGKRTGKVVSVGHMLRQTGHSAGPTAVRLRASAAKRLSNRGQQGTAEEVAKRVKALDLAKTPEEKAKAQARLDYSRQLVTPNAIAETNRLAARVEMLDNMSDEDVLEQFFVMEDTGIPANDFDVTDGEFAAMRTLQTKGKTRDKDADAKRKATLFAVEVGDQGRTMNVSAESIWKTWAKKMQRLGEAFRGESKKAFIARMFMEGLGGLRLRDDVVSIPGLRDDLLIDRETGLTWGDVKARSTQFPGVKMPRLPLENPEVVTEGVGDIKDEYAPGLEYDAETGEWDDTGAIEQRAQGDTKFRAVKRKRDTGAVDSNAENIASVERKMRKEEDSPTLIPSVVQEETRASRARDERRNTPRKEDSGEMAKEEEERKSLGLGKEIDDLFRKVFALPAVEPAKAAEGEEEGPERHAALVRAWKQVGKIINVVFDDLGISFAGLVGVREDEDGSNIPDLVLGSAAVIAGARYTAREAVDHEVGHVAVSAIYHLYGADVAQRVVNLANRPHILAQVIKDSKARGLDTRYFEVNPEEAFAQAYMMWSAGKLKLDVKQDTLLKRVFQKIKTLLAKLTGDDVLNQIFSATERGDLNAVPMTLEDTARAMITRSQDVGFTSYNASNLTHADLERLKKNAPERLKPAFDLLLQLPEGKTQGAGLGSYLLSFDTLAGQGWAPKDILDVARTQLENFSQTQEDTVKAASSTTATPEKLNETWVKRIDEIGKTGDYSALDTPEKTFAFMRAAARRVVDLLKERAPSDEDELALEAYQDRQDIARRFIDEVFGDLSNKAEFLTASKGWSALSKAEQAKMLEGSRDLNQEVGDAARARKKNPSRNNSEYIYGAQITTLTEAEKKTAIDEIVKRRGKDINVAFNRIIGGSGLYDQAARLITISLGVGGNLMNVVRHESLHDLFATIVKSDALQRKTWEEVKTALSKPYVRNQLKRLLKDHPAAVKDMMEDPEEAAAYAYQFWAAGHLTLGPTVSNFFTRVMEYLRNMMGILSQEDKVEKLLLAFDEGKFSGISTAGAVLRDLQLETLKDKIERVAKPLAEVGEKLFTSGTDQLRAFGFAPLTEIADSFYREAEREKGGELPFIQATNRQRAIFMNRVSAAVGGQSRENIMKAWHSLIRGEPTEGPSAKIAADLRVLLDDTHAYMKARGVKRLDTDKDGRVRESEIGFLKDYFPRAWDPAKVRAGKRDFIALLVKHGHMMTVSEATNVFHALSDKDGQVNLAENDHHIGFTPYLKNIQRRTLKFINQTNVRDFEKFMDNDLVNTISTYVIQATHRAEYAHRFGNSGQVIRSALGKARAEGASDAEIDRAAKVIRGLEGTLNHNFSREARQLFNVLTTYQNIVLLPLALMNSIVDPMGIAVRSGDWQEAWRGLHEGFRGLGLALIGEEKSDERRRLAEDLGIIDNTLQLAVLGDVYSGPYMSKWLKQVNEKFFRWNGMSIWNDRMRIAALAAAERFIVKHSKIALSRSDKAVFGEAAKDIPDFTDAEIEQSKRYMDELGVDLGDVFVINDKLSIDKDAIADSIRMILGEDKGQFDNFEGRVDEDALASAGRLKDALYKFVDGAILRPNAAHRPTWGSDPMWQLVFHLKQFAFSFQNTILRRGIHELEHGNTLPTTMLATYIPIAMVMGSMRAIMLGKELGGPIQMLTSGVAQSGVMGVGIFGHEAFLDAANGGTPGQSFAGPTINHGIDIAQTVAGAPGQDIGRLLERSAPLSPLVRAVN